VDFLTGPELLAYVAGDTTPAADDGAWADDVAAAVNAALTRELDYPVDTVMSPESVADLHVAALAIGAERMKRREAPFGIAGYDVSGGAVRISGDDLAAGRVAIVRWAYSATVGLA
jgi:alpha-D-ribose 1-methylphosphonate 5-triphosphate synthase subunit PhnI